MDDKEKRKQWANEDPTMVNTLAGVTTAVSTALGYACMSGLADKIDFQSLPFVFAGSAIVAGSFLYKAADDFVIRHYDKSIADIAKGVFGKSSDNQSESNIDTATPVETAKNITTDNIAKGRAKDIASDRAQRNRDRIMQDMGMDR